MNNTGEEINLLQLFKNKEWKKYIVNYLLNKQNFELEDLKMYIVRKKKQIKDLNNDYCVVRSFDVLFIINDKEINIKSHKLHKSFSKLLKNGDEYLFNPKNKYFSKEILEYL